MKYSIIFVIAFLFCCCDNKSQIKNEEPKIILTNDQIREAIVNEENIKIDSIGILLYDGFFDLDAIGPYSVLSSMIGTKVFYVSTKKGIINSSSGIGIKVETEISDVSQLDILVVPGGTIGTVKASKNSKIIDWIKMINQNSIFTTSVCTGAWILGEAGLLENKKATTNWYRAEEKLNKYNAEFVNERWVRDGKVWTSAGVSAGIDMSLALISEIKGETYAKMVMLNLEYDPKPPFEGGSVSKTNIGIVNYMTQMYDTILKDK